MGSKTSKVDDSTANVINTIEVVDHKDEIAQVYQVLRLIAGLLIVLLMLKGLSTYKKVIQGRRDRRHELEKVVSLANNWSCDHK